MKIKHLLLVGVVAGMLAGAWIVFAQSEAKPGGPTADPRIDKLLEQNEQILKNQAEMLKQLEGLKQDLLQLRRRAS